MVTTMSADRWSICPRCRDQQWAKLVAVREEVESGYGALPPDDFIKQLHDAQAALDAFAPEPTFREDYEFYGAGAYADGTEGGTLSVRYSGHCKVCDLDVKFEHDEPFYSKVNP